MEVINKYFTEDAVAKEAGKSAPFYTGLLLI